MAFNFAHPKQQTFLGNNQFLTSSLTFLSNSYKISRHQFSGTRHYDTLMALYILTHASLEKQLELRP